jgi:RNA polymerase sigma-70 factor (ECF subfamily)
MDMNECAIEVLAPGGSVTDGSELLVDRAYRLALRITGVEEDAAKVVEDTILTASRASDSLEGPLAGRVILQTVAKAAYERLRARRPLVHEIGLDDVLPMLDGEGRHFESLDDWSSRIDDRSLQVALRTVLAEAIDALPADDRTALVLHDVEGAPKPDIADVLSIDVATVNARVHRARLFLRKRLSSTSSPPASDRWGVGRTKR